MAYVLGGLVVLAALAFVIWPLFRPVSSPETVAETETSPAEQRAAIYRELMELELDQRLGKIDEADRQAQADALMARAAALIGEEDATRESIDERLEREIAAERQSLYRSAVSRTGETQP